MSWAIARFLELGNLGGDPGITFLSWFVQPQVVVVVDLDSILENIYMRFR